MVLITGVRASGGASLDPSRYVATLTVGGSNHPHGIVNFAATSLRITARELNTTVNLTVIRKYGAIGEKMYLLNCFTGLASYAHG